MRFLARLVSDRLKGLGSFIGAGAWWLAEWAAEKIFGDTAFAWLRAMTAGLLEHPWIAFAWTYGIPLGLITLGIFFFVRAGRSKPSKESANSKEALALNQSNATGSVIIMLERLLIKPPTVFPASGEIYGFDFFPNHIYSGPFRGTPGSPKNWGIQWPDLTVHEPLEAVRMTLATDKIIYSVSYKIEVEFRESVPTPDGGTISGEAKETSEFWFNFPRVLPNDPIDLWLYTQSFDIPFLILPREVSYFDINSSEIILAKIICAPMYGATVLQAATGG